MKLTRLLAFRLLAGIFIVMVVGITALTIFLLNFQSDKSTNYFVATAMRVSDIIKRSTHYSMLLNRREDIYNIIKTIGSEPGIEGIRIYNKQGVISFSTIENEVGKTVDMNAEACIVCHTNGNSLTVTPKNPQLIRYFKKSQGDRVIAVITPIKNQQSCSTAECHAHSPGQTVLGVLDVMIPLKDLDSNLSEFQQLYFDGGLILLFVVTSFSGIFLWRMVNVPVRRLAAGTEEVMKGNLDYTINVQTKDEIGSLTKSFNHMTRKLKQTQEELRQLNQTLEERVQKKTEELRRAQANLIQVEKMVSLGTLAATVAHELNNPLEGILTYAKLIRKKLAVENLTEGEKSEITSELTMIANETARCGNIVKNLLLFSRQKVGEFKENNVRTIIEQSLKLIDHHLKMNSISLHTEFDDHLADIHCDAEQIQQALLALQINAVEAMPNGGELTIKALNSNHPAIIIKICDTGTGIRDEDLPHIFEPFYTTKHEGKGTGLGLAVVYGIVERHRGRISVDSVVNHGTTFTMTLPVIPEHEIEHSGS
ncbi:MAG: ATP-binding protein [Bacteroidota bacterium]|nr:ATP-binding protein [Bacteroidota bacterium]